MAVEPSDKIVRGADLSTIGSLIKTKLGEKQDAISSVTVTVDSNVGTPSGTASMSGDTLSFSFSNLKGEPGEQGKDGEQGPQGEKGDQGNSGYSGAAGELEVVNNLTSGGATAALSAEMGKKLGEDVAYLMEGFSNIAAWAFKGEPSLANPIYRDVAFFPSSSGVAVLRYGYTSTLTAYMMSPVFSLGENGALFSLSFSTGEITTTNNATYPGLVYLDKDMAPYTYHLGNSNPRTVTGTVSDTMKYIRLLFKVEKILDTYVYDNTRDEYIFRGGQVNLATTESKEKILTSDYWEDWGPNDNGDWIGWNFATTDVAATNQRSVVDYPMFKMVGQSSSDFSYSISKIIELPSGQSSLGIEFSCGEVDTGLMLRLLNPAAGTANYYSANANPRSETINTNTYTHAQLYFKTSKYSSCYLKDTTNNVMLWEGPSSSE